MPAASPAGADAPEASDIVLAVRAKAGGADAALREGEVGARSDWTVARVLAAMRPQWGVGTLEFGGRALRDDETVRARAALRACMAWGGRSCARARRGWQTCCA